MRVAGRWAWLKGDGDLDCELAGRSAVWRLGVCPYLGAKYPQSFPVILFRRRAAAQIRDNSKKRP
jgi:hypothetical protein